MKIDETTIGFNGGTAVAPSQLISSDLLHPCYVAFGRRLFWDRSNLFRSRGSGKCNTFDVLCVLAVILFIVALRQGVIETSILETLICKKLFASRALHTHVKITRFIKEGHMCTLSDLKNMFINF